MRDSNKNFLDALKKIKSSVEIKTDYATRLTVATDNSVYQVIPAAVLFPKTTADIVAILTLANEERFKTIYFALRGGGTGTNGQSLSAGIIIDCSKYMREILEINLAEQWVRVQPGVILDELNIFLKKHGMHFAPEISPSNRATIGGMINTDACGNGSKVIGRTSDHVISLTAVLADGSTICTEEPQSLDFQKKLVDLIAPHTVAIQEKFIARPRNLNGYNLLKAYQNQQINLNYLFCGSEGTLSVIAEAKLNITPLPKFKKLLLAKYKSFDDALRVKQTSHAIVIEAIDEKLLELARSDAIYFQLKNMLDHEVQPNAINLVEFFGDDEAELNQAVNNFCEEDKKSIGFYLAKNAEEIKLLWDLRKKSVGLISKKQAGTRRPIPFVEDTAVPPEKLADYMSEFKKLLDRYDLVYGMYGHVDAGCVHVRPALDLKLTADEKLFQTLSNEVANLLEKFGGVMWGEHGMGFRTHYAEHFFGKTLYQVVRQIKTLFDPHNKLNPGKIALPLESEANLVSINGPLRATFDKQISVETQNQFANVMACNGNGACFNYATAETMCPSYKVTKDRIHSPKGRAVLMREWLRLTGAQHQMKGKTAVSLFSNKADFSKEIYTAMNGCLSCKACASQCPLNVDIPSAKAIFLNEYHQKNFRPWRDYLIANLETMAPFLSQIAFFSSWIMKSKFIQYLFKKIFKLVDVPPVSVLSVKKRQHPFFHRHPIVPPYLNLTAVEKNNAVILLQDAFTSFYDNDVAIKVYDFLASLNFKVFVLPFFPNGKPKQVKGFLSSFEKIAKKNIYYLTEVAKSDIPMIGIDPSITLTYRDEYKKIANNDNVTVYLVQEWLVKKLSTLNIKPLSNKTYFLLTHCTEKTACPEAEHQWKIIFEKFGLTLHTLPAGCCGMAGAYGHELEHAHNSKQLFTMDWEQHLQAHPSVELLATGYSCRSQAKRFANQSLRHPIEVLLG